MTEILMESALELSISGFDGKDLAGKVRKEIELFVNVLLHAGFDLRRLKRITITTDIISEINQLSKLPGKPINTTITNEHYAKAVGKLIKRNVDNDFEMYLFLDSQLVLPLALEVDDGGEAHTNSLHYLHHELAHVHDNNRQWDILGGSMMRASYTGTKMYTGLIAERVWAEYYANFISSQTASAGIVLEAIDAMCEAVSRVESETAVQIWLYRGHGDIDALMNWFSQHGHFLPIAASYVIGYLHGSQKNIEDYSPQAKGILENSKFGTLWDELNQTLEEMRKQYPKDWFGLESYSPLWEFGRHYYSAMGLELSSVSTDMVYVHVP